MRLCDLDALEAELVQDYAYAAARMVAKAPTIDAVPVVRCKDCEYWVSPDGNDAHYCRLDYGLQGIVAEEDFCSYGERKDGDGNG